MSELQTTRAFAGAVMSIAAAFSNANNAIAHDFTQRGPGYVQHCSDIFIGQGYPTGQHHCERIITRPPYRDHYRGHRGGWGHRDHRGSGVIVAPNRRGGGCVSVRVPGIDFTICN